MESVTVEKKWTAQDEREKNLRHNKKCGTIGIRTKNERDKGMEGTKTKRDGEKGRASPLRCEMGLINLRLIVSETWDFQGRINLCRQIMQPQQVNASRHFSSVQDFLCNCMGCTSISQATMFPLFLVHSIVLPLRSSSSNYGKIWYLFPFSSFNFITYNYYDIFLIEFNTQVSAYQFNVHLLIKIK